jgi:asparagine synthase (glutamine-hydrolysing)
MCGICGSVGIEDRPLVESMTRLIAHRGPDGEGVRTFAASNGLPPASLGHRRLSIIDPGERGAQPMSYADGRYWTTYNGEIYNFRSLRAELERDGLRFRTDCDTEVLLAMYARHGARMLERLNGIYAFAIWDSTTGDMFLARDPLGVKPLYYARDRQRLHFASEVKALLPAIGTPRMRRDTLLEYLTFLWVPDPDTLFEEVSKLPPGHYARFQGGELQIRRYWDPAFAVDRTIPRAEWPELVRGTVQDAVRRQMVSDVPLGAFLSGGLDSSAVVATMRGDQDPMSTYTVGFDQADLAHEIVPDDLRYARRLADRFSLDYNERILRPDIVDLLPKLVWHLDEPVADPAAIVTYLICSAAREKLTVILSGMGGDEVFAGYPRHLAAQLTRPADLLPARLRRSLREALEGRLTTGGPGRMRGPRRNLMKLMRGIDQPPIDRYLTYSAYYRSDELPRLLSRELRHEQAGTDPFARHRAHAERMSAEQWINQMLYVDLKTFLPCLNLTYTDKMSMAASTEVRVPLLDDEVVALAATIPPELKLHRLRRKYVLKRAMEGVLPEDVIWRPKAGFGAPLRAWLGGELRPMVEDLLSPQAIRDRGLFEPAEVQRLIRENDAGTADNTLRIWALLVLELWQQTFIEGGQAREPTELAGGVPG